MDHPRCTLNGCQWEALGLNKCAPEYCVEVHTASDKKIIEAAQKDAQQVAGSSAQRMSSAAFAAAMGQHHLCGMAMNAPERLVESADVSRADDLGNVISDMTGHFAPSDCSRGIAQWVEPPAITVYECPSCGNSFSVPDSYATIVLCPCDASLPTGIVCHRRVTPDER
jgi:hypothetical protein